MKYDKVRSREILISSDGPLGSILGPILFFFSYMTFNNAANCFHSYYFPMTLIYLGKSGKSVNEIQVEIITYEITSKYPNGESRLLRYSNTRPQYGIKIIYS